MELVDEDHSAFEPSICVGKSSICTFRRSNVATHRTKPKMLGVDPAGIVIGFGSSYNNYYNSIKYERYDMGDDKPAF